ncbi:helix-turn-helix domain-containing protein [Halobacterium litoreum]|uniref:Helix-turn-helix domain-containing protein n=1 Tax=Halobacterium litoreum TaxID=2039234 RepID=A0ABD5N9D2_9EURY|nr:helix-turn-helix domain-containing protein [Halobacterium litoreum]UHH12070.1 helix-turn-helix domain-containing protein [Halobacterium litoreum]
MTVIAELTLSSPKIVLHESMTAAPDVTVDIESLDGLDPEQPEFVFWAKGTGLDDFDAALREDPSVGTVSRLDVLDDRYLYRIQFSDDVGVVLYPHWLSTGAVLLNLDGQNGEWEARMRFPDRGALREFRTFCEGEDIDFGLQRIYDEPVPEAPGPLTDAQREALEIALERGYFEVPRECSLAEVADEIGVSEQSVSERLRRAARHLVRDAVD